MISASKSDIIGKYAAARGRVARVVLLTAVIICVLCACQNIERQGIADAATLSFTTDEPVVTSVETIALSDMVAHGKTDVSETEAKKPETEAKKPETEAKKPETEVEKPETEAKKPETEAENTETEFEDTEPPSQTTSDTDAVVGYYVLNVNTKKIHFPSCASVETIKSENRSEYNGAREDLISQGYSPCKRCNP